LEDHLEIAAQWAESSLAEVGNFTPIEKDFSRGGVEESDKGFPKSGFPATRLADKAERLTDSELEGNAVHGFHRAGLFHEQAGAHGKMHP
jgi:hypothetical protein